MRARVGGLCLHDLLHDCRQRAPTGHRIPQRAQALGAQLSAQADGELLQQQLWRFLAGRPVKPCGM